MIVRDARRRRFRLWLALAVLGILMVVASTCFYTTTRYLGGRELQLVLAETDKLDPNWRLEDLEAHRRPMPPLEKNGFERVLSVIRAMQAQPYPQRAFPKYDRMQPVAPSEAEIGVIRAQLERIEGPLVLLRQMVDFPDGRGPSIVPAQGSLLAAPPKYFQVLGAAKILIPDAYVRICAGDVAGALRDVRAMVHIASALADEPDLMAQLVRQAVDILAVEMLERTLSAGIVSEHELAVVQQELEDEAAGPMDLLGLRGHRAAMDHLLEGAQSGMISRNQLWAQITFAGSSQVSFSARFMENVRFMLLWSNLAGERARFLRNNNELISIVQLPAHERFPALREYIARGQREEARSYPSAPYFGGSVLYAKYLEDEIGPHALLLSTITALAAERFRLANEQWPNNLEDLTRTYLKSVPIDPYSGQPLRLARKGSVLIIYSIGADQKDDGGTLSPTFNNFNPDLGFILHDPKVRTKAGSVKFHPSDGGN